MLYESVISVLFVQLLVMQYCYKLTLACFFLYIINYGTFQYMIVQEAIQCFLFDPMYIYIYAICNMHNIEIFIRYTFHSSLHICEIDPNSDRQTLPVKCQSDYCLLSSFLFQYLKVFLVVIVIPCLVRFYSQAFSFCFNKVFSGFCAWAGLLSLYRNASDFLMLIFAPCYFAGVYQL